MKIYSKICRKYSALHRQASIRSSFSQLVWIVIIFITFIHIASSSNIFCPFIPSLGSVDCYLFFSKTIFCKWTRREKNLIQAIMYHLFGNGNIWKYFLKNNISDDLFGWLIGKKDWKLHEYIISRLINPLMPNGSFNICCPRDCVSRHNGGTSGAPLMPRDAVSRTANVEGTVRH